LRRAWVGVRRAAEVLKSTSVVPEIERGLACARQCVRVVSIQAKRAGKVVERACRITGGEEHPARAGLNRWLLGEARGQNEQLRQRTRTLLVGEKELDQFDSDAPLSETFSGRHRAASAFS
jgi:hypothetical protein